MDDKVRMQCIVRILSILAVFLVTSCPAFSQVNFTFGDKNAKSCDDFATTVLNDPWDMSSSSDINNFFKGVDIQHFTNPRFTSGQFLGLTSDPAAYFYLFSPEPSGAFSIGGRWGPRIGFDSSKYTRFSMKFSTDVPDPYGVRMIWDRGQNYAGTRNIALTGLNKYHTGVNTISVDLSTLNTFQDSYTQPWSSAPVTGLAIIPTTQSGANIAIDWIRLEDPTTCSGGAFTTQTMSYTAAANGNDDLMSLYLVEDGVTNPLISGYARKFSSSVTPTDGSVSLTDSLGIYPGKYRLISILDSDFATLERDNPWDFNDNTDLFDTNNSLPGISNASFAGGVLSGTSSSGKILLNVGSGLDRSKYKYVTIKGTFTSLPGITGAAGYRGATDAGSNYYTIDLSSAGAWTGTESNYLQVVIPSGNFTIDFVSIRKTGFDTGFNRSDATVLTNSKIGTPSSSTVIINTPPQFDIKTPNERGGEAVRAWNMNDGDLNVFSNLASETDPSFPSEKLTSFLPDVRAIDGVRGDFFKGTNINGNDDPDNYSTFPFAGFNNFTFDSAEYKNLCFKLLIDRDFSLGTGSVGRVIWLADGPFYISEDLPLITDNWSGSRWYNYCVDMTELYTDGTTQNNWSGIIKAFRIDAHEFTPQTSYYFDSIKLRKDFRAPGVFSVAYEANDVDNDPITLTFYASSTKNTLGTAISGASFTVPSDSRVYNLNTTTLANGTYYINATASDGVNAPVTRYGLGRVVVDNSGSQGIAPVLSLEAPVAAATYCDTLQVKGYSLQSDRLEDVSTVEVLIDGAWLTNIYPDVYNGYAKAAYPNADSSNAGFNQLIDISSITAGAHTASIISHSTKGLMTTLTRSFTKSSTGCTTPITDPDPAGVPVTVNLSTTPTPRPTATPIPNPVTVSSAKHSRTGGVTITLKGLSSSLLNCKANLYVQDKPGATLKKFSSGTITSKDIKKKILTFTGTGITVAAKGPSSVYISNTLTCGSKTKTQSATRTMKLARGKKGASSYASLVKLMARVKKR